MIEVSGLTRRYGDCLAVDDLSFEVARGEVVGFLGPNGAGKSTTMRMLCGCIGATAGTARIGGIDVSASPREAKARIGYLPEVPPLYPTMTVRDYVAFAARIRGVCDPAGATARTLDRVGLAAARNRILDHLSKGFRQRVGLAQALVHDPELLVLDEPTSGLDPAQRKEIRDLLLELAAGERTVLLSTHVLAEVEAVCERVIILNEGRIVATDRIAALAQSSHHVRLRVSRPDAVLAQRLQGLAAVESVEPEADGGFRVVASEDVREAVARVAVDAGLLELGAARSLEDAYLELTEQASGGEG